MSVNRGCERDQSGERFLGYSAAWACAHLRPRSRAPYSSSALDRGLAAGAGCCARQCCMYTVCVRRLRFEWDERKNRSNRVKHGISFEEAETVFLDDNAVIIDDPDHSEDEARFLLLGFSLRLHVLVVCHCCRSDGEVIRIISARKADRSERATYTRRSRT